MTTQSTATEWREVPISTLAHFSRGISWRKVEESSDGILVVSIPNIKDGRIDFESKYNHYITKTIPENKKLRIGDIIFVGSSGSLHNVGRNAMVKELPTGVAAFASFAFNARPDTSEADPDFLYFLCNSSQVPFNRYTKRAADGKYNFQLRDFEKNLRLKVPLLPEQKAIARVLTTVQNAIAEQERLIAKLKELKRSMMGHLFTHGTKGEKTKMTDIGEIPESWEEIEIDALGKIITGSTPSTKNEKYYFPVEVDFITPGDINEDRYVKSTERGVSRAGAKVGRAVPKDAVCCVCIGSSIGKVATVYRDAITNQQINSIICDSKYDSDFVYHLLTFYSPHWRGHATFGPVPLLSKGSFSKIKLPVTFDKKEQCRIGHTLSVIDLRIEAVQEKVAVYQNLFKTLLHELMSGERRIKNI